MSVNERRHWGEEGGEEGGREGRMRVEGGGVGGKRGWLQAYGAVCKRISAQEPALIAVGNRR